MNKQRINELADFIDLLPEGAFNMGTFFTEGDDPRDVPISLFAGTAPERMHNCNSQGCIAGWAVAFFGDPDEGHHDVEDYAARLLKLTRNEASMLFYGQWPEFDGPRDFTAITRDEAVAHLRSIAA